MKTHTVIFNAEANKAKLYGRTDSGHAITRDVTVDSYADEVASLLNWLSGQLPEGFGELRSVVIDTLPPVPVSWEDNEPVDVSPAYSLAITGGGDSGEITINVQSVPGTETNLLASLIEDLSCE